MVTHHAGKCNTNADIISQAKHIDEPTPLWINSITQGKKELYPVPWSKVNNCSEYIPPSCKGKIFTIVELPLQLAGAKGIEGRGPPLIGALQGKIVIDQYDLEKAQLNNGALNLVRS